MEKLKSNSIQTLKRLKDLEVYKDRQYYPTEMIGWLSEFDPTSYVLTEDDIDLSEAIPNIPILSELTYLLTKRGLSNLYVITYGDSDITCHLIVSNDSNELMKLKKLYPKFKVGQFVTVKCTGKVYKGRINKIFEKGVKFMNTDETSTRVSIIIDNNPKHMAVVSSHDVLI
jgi:ribosomal protein L21E